MSRLDLIRLILLSFSCLSVAPLCAQPGEPPRRVAFLVGVSKYDKDGLRNLDFPEKDVTDLAQALRTAGFEVHSLLGSARGAERATGANLRRLFGVERAMGKVQLGLWMRELARLNRQDVAFVFFTGHGVQRPIEREGKSIDDALFCPADASKNDPDTLFSLGELIRNVGEHSGTSQNLLVIDACRDDPGKGAKNIDGATMRSLPDKVGVLFGSSAGQQSYESKHHGHGLLTKALLEGIAGEASYKGEVTWGLLTSYAQRRVPTLARELELEQRPNVIANLTSDPVLASRNAAKPEYDLTGGFRFVHFGPTQTRVVLWHNDDANKTFFARVYDANTGRPLSSPMNHADDIDKAAFSPDGTKVVTASWDHSAGIWDASTGNLLTPFLKYSNWVYHAAFSPNGSRLAVGSFDHLAHVWDSKTGKSRTPPLRHTSWVRHVAFSPDGKRVVTASGDHTARVWDAMTGKPVGLPLKHANPIFHAAFSPDGHWVVTSSYDKTARIWNVATGQSVTPPLTHSADVDFAVFSPGGTMVVTASRDNTACVWDAKTGRLLFPPLQHRKSVSHASFSSDGTRVVTASGDKTARVWSILTGQPLSPPLNHDAWVTLAAFSPDGSRVISSTDRTAYVWDAKTGRELKKITITAD